MSALETRRYTELADCVIPDMADSLRELVKLKQKELELYAEVTKKMFPTGDTAEYPVSWESLLYSFQCYVEEDITRTDIGDIRERLERAGITKENAETLGFGWAFSK